MSVIFGHIKSSEAKWWQETDGQEKPIERLINLLSSWWKEDFGKLSREEAFNRQLQKQKAFIPTFGPVPLVDGTHTLIPPAEPTPTETPSSTPLLSSTLSTPIRRILQREVEIESAMEFGIESTPEVSSSSIVKIHPSQEREWFH